jgi:hypothetical protein
MQDELALSALETAAQQEGIQFEKKSRVYNTSWMRAAKELEHQLQAGVVLAAARQGGSKKRRRHTIAEAAAAEPAPYQVSDIIHVANGCCLVAHAKHTSPDGGAVLQMVKAVPGPPTADDEAPFSCVLVDVEHYGRPQVWYAQLLLLFSVNVQLGDHIEQPIQEREYAYVGFFEEVRSPAGEKDGLHLLGCARLQWRAPSNQAELTYEVLPLSNLVCKQHIVPAWGQGSNNCSFRASVLLEHLSDL